MRQHEIKNILERLEHLMYGYNYQVTLGLKTFDECSTIEDFKRNLKKEFADSQPDKIQLIEMTHADFWEEIEFALNFRGDKTAGLELNKKEELILQEEQKKYIDFLKSNIGSTTKVFSYPDETGIPGYPVYWDFRFLTMTVDKKCLFIYGAASD